MMSDDRLEAYLGQQLSDIQSLTSTDESATFRPNQQSSIKAMTAVFGDQFVATITSSTMRTTTQFCEKLARSAVGTYNGREGGKSKNLRDLLKLSQAAKAIIESQDTGHIHVLLQVVEAAAPFSEEWATWQEKIVDSIPRTTSSASQPHYHSLESMQELKSKILKWHGGPTLKDEGADALMMFKMLSATRIRGKDLDKVLILW